MCYKSLFTFYYCCVILCFFTVTGRTAPYYDLNNAIYSDIRNIFDDHLTRKIVDQIDHPQEVQGWGPNVSLGQVSGVALDKNGNPVIFHRANRIWNLKSFNSTEHFQELSAIQDHVVLTLNRETGGVMNSWGGGMFYLPHGITIDSEGNIWLIDIALHQVFKFAPKSNTPSLTLGEKLQPGSDNAHFCKPTSVAVSSKGEFFVADGYCNSRIMHFNSDGTLKGQYGNSGSERRPSMLSVPHGLALNEDLDVLCIADREHARIICVKAGLLGMSAFGEEVAELQDPDHIRIFDISFFGNSLMGIAGSEEETLAVGFTADLQQGGVVDEWQPIQGFRNPHSIVVDEKRNCMYVGEMGPNRVWKFNIEQIP